MIVVVPPSLGSYAAYAKSGETRTNAKSNLTAFFVEHTGTFGDGALASDDTVQRLLDFWFEKAQQSEAGPSSETLERYRCHMRWVRVTSVPSWLWDTAGWLGGVLQLSVGPDSLVSPRTSQQERM